VKMITLIRMTLSVVAATFALVSVAHASAARTFVSGAGNDANAGTNCGAAAPCRTFAVAYGVTTAGGEIIALDSAGYGSLTITQAINIVGAHPASITVAAGTTGISINAGSNLVTLRNLQITGGGAANTTGIALTAGKLAIYNSVLKGLTTGLTVTSSHADVVNSDFDGNATAIQTNGVGAGYNGPYGFSGPAPTLVRINAGNMIGNTTVFNENNPTVVNGQSTATIFIFQSGTQFSANITGYTTMMTITGTGGNVVGPQTYSSTGAPN
jgi:hypothetical protein